MRTIIRNNYTPKAGDYHERIIIDNSRHKTWLFDCDGIWTDITKIHLAEEFGDSSDIGLSQKFITEQFKVTDEKIEGVREEVGELSERVDGVEENLNIEIENRMAADEDLQENIDKVAEDLENLKNSPDVVDIVNTKADLDAYDTSTLSQNDIIRVLKDETQDGASTYYKWTGSTWEFIGAVGPYYTKTETDSLLSTEATAREEGDADLQGQINSLSDNTYTKPEVDGLLDEKQDELTAGENITIENNVISATGGTKSVELTQAEYDALTPEQKMDGTVYYITDGQGGGKTYTGGKGITVDNVNDKISVNDGVIEFTGKIDNGPETHEYALTTPDDNELRILALSDKVVFNESAGGSTTTLRPTETINDTDWSALWQ